MDREQLRRSLITVASAISVYSMPAVAQPVAPSAQRLVPVRVGVGISQYGSLMPDGLVAQASVGLGHRRNVSVVALASVRWHQFDRSHAEFFPADPDSSHLKVLSSVAVRMEVTVSRHIAMAALGGFGAGSWKDLPSIEADRKPIRVPYLGAGGMFRVAREVSIELSVENFRNVYHGDDATNVTLVVSVPLRL